MSFEWSTTPDNRLACNTLWHSQNTFMTKSFSDWNGNRQAAAKCLVSDTWFDYGKIFKKEEIPQKDTKYLEQFMEWFIFIFGLKPPNTTRWVYVGETTCFYRTSIRNFRRNSIKIVKWVHRKFLEEPLCKNHAETQNISGKNLEILELFLEQSLVRFLKKKILKNRPRLYLLEKNRG